MKEMIKENVDRNNPIEDINIFWCFIVMSFLGYLPEVLENLFIGYLLLLIVFTFLFKIYLDNRQINIIYILGKFKMNIFVVIGFLLMSLTTHIMLKGGLIYVFSYIKPDIVLSYYNKPVSYVLTISTFVYIVIIVPIVEEIFYRGILLNRLKNKQIRVRLIISSCIFGIMHLEWFIPASIIGYIFGYIYLKYSSLYQPILLHFFVNLTTYLFRFAEQSSIKSLTQIREESYPFFLITMSTILIYSFLFKKSQKNIKSFKEVPYIKNKLNGGLK